MAFLLSLMLFFQTASPPQITLYYSPRCPYSQKVLSYMKEHDIHIPLKDVTKDPLAREELKKYGGHLIVPCLLVDHTPIYNANDIIEWLANHPTPRVS